jgi:hypothetical protein
MHLDKGQAAGSGGEDKGYFGGIAEQLLAVIEPGMGIGVWATHFGIELLIDGYETLTV